MAPEFWHKKGPELLQQIDTTSVSPDSLAIWFFGQASFAVKAAGIIIYIDPFFSPYLDEQGKSKRRFEPPFAPSDITHADWIFCTHDHLDHLDIHSLVPMAKASQRARFIVPAPHMSVLTKAGIDASRVLPARVD